MFALSKRMQVGFIFTPPNPNSLIFSSIGEMCDWDGQSPPTPIHQTGKPVVTKEELGQEIPSFGPYNKIKETVILLRALKSTKIALKFNA